ncbi:hypothetical protein SLOPH_970 [Spraguea lophii 42_110]|uniref:Uncharacterized protein n=1 Tax=Spraguea lophii (strain 42_110) TaxID=1358809 RepID=S7WAW4_SPRLO|nr:hypothetical protein SLOPH_970 [Spraguea lophii 42_110]
MSKTMIYFLYLFNVLATENMLRNHVRAYDNLVNPDALQDFYMDVKKEFNQFSDEDFKSMEDYVYDDVELPDKSENKIKKFFSVIILRLRGFFSADDRTDVENTGDEENTEKTITPQNIDGQTPGEEVDQTDARIPHTNVLNPEIENNLNVNEIEGEKNTSRILEDKKIKPETGIKPQSNLSKDNLDSQDVKDINQTETNELENSVCSDDSEIKTTDESMNHQFAIPLDLIIEQSDDETSSRIIKESETNSVSSDNESQRDNTSPSFMKSLLSKNEKDYEHSSSKDTTFYSKIDNDSLDESSIFNKEENNNNNTNDENMENEMIDSDNLIIPEINSEIQHNINPIRQRLDDSEVTQSDLDSKEQGSFPQKTTDDRTNDLKNKDKGSLEDENNGDNMNPNNSNVLQNPQEKTSLTRVEVVPDESDKIVSEISDKNSSWEDEESNISQKEENIGKKYIPLNDVDQEIEDESQIATTEDIPHMIPSSSIPVYERMNIDKDMKAVTRDSTEEMQPTASLENKQNESFDNVNSAPQELLDNQLPLSSDENINERESTTPSTSLDLPVDEILNQKILDGPNKNMPTMDETFNNSSNEDGGLEENIEQSINSPEDNAVPEQIIVNEATSLQNECPLPQDNEERKILETARNDDEINKRRLNLEDRQDGNSDNVNSNSQESLDTRSPLSSDDNINENKKHNSDLKNERESIIPSTSLDLPVDEILNQKILDELDKHISTMDEAINKAFNNPSKKDKDHEENIEQSVNSSENNAVPEQIVVNEDTSLQNECPLSQENVDDQDKDERRILETTRSDDDINRRRSNSEDKENENSDNIDSNPQESLDNQSSLPGDENINGHESTTPSTSLDLSANDGSKQRNMGGLNKSMSTIKKAFNKMFNRPSKKDKDLENIEESVTSPEDNAVPEQIIVNEDTSLQNECPLPQENVDDQNTKIQSEFDNEEKTEKTEKIPNTDVPSPQQSISNLSSDDIETGKEYFSDDLSNNLEEKSRVLSEDRNNSRNSGSLGSPKSSESMNSQLGDIGSPMEFTDNVHIMEKKKLPCLYKCSNCNSVGYIREEKFTHNGMAISGNLIVG